MTGADSSVSSPSEPRPWWSRTAPLLLLTGLSLLPEPGAALPRSAYFFRDLSIAFYPVRSFAAEELRGGRWPVWNPYLFEGTFALPYFHVLDFLHVPFPGPVAFSFLLTLQFPIAALGAYALLRDLGAGRTGAFAAGALFALGGLTRSSANLYVFLQALALAPLVVLGVRRAAALGGRSVALAAIVIALGLTTLAVEFVAQSILLGASWAILERPGPPVLRRVASAVALGLALAGPALLPMFSLLPETERGAGLQSEVLLGHATPPLALLQLLVPNLFGSVADPVQVWWGRRFFPRLPYFLTLYVGPVALALAFAGWKRLAGAQRALLATAGALGVWFALGEAGGLAPLLFPQLPGVRFPSKAWLLPYLVVTVLAGLGADELAKGRGAVRFASTSVALALVAAVPFLVAVGSPGSVQDLFGLEAESVPAVCQSLARDAAVVVVVALVGAALGLALSRGLLDARRGAQLAVALLAADLVRTHAGMNPQVDPSFFRLLPELAAELPGEEGGRVFSYPLATSPAFNRYLEGRPAQVRLGSFYLTRQMLSPYSNILDHVGSPGDRDLASLTPRPPELREDDYRPEEVGRIVPWMRQAAVSRVLSLDPLEHPDLALRRSVPLGPPGLVAHVYELARPGPLVYLACRVRLARTREEAAAQALEAGFDPSRDVSLEQEVRADCAHGGVRLVKWEPAERRYRVEASAPGLLVERESFAAGWHAALDGQSTVVLRANGKNRAVPVPAGVHDVMLRYEAPLLRAGVASTALGVVIAGVLLVRRG